MDSDSEVEKVNLWVSTRTSLKPQPSTSSTTHAGESPTIGFAAPINEETQSLLKAAQTEEPEITPSTIGDPIEPKLDPPPCLTWTQKVLYGLPQLGSNFGNVMLNSWLTYYYIPPESDNMINAGLFGTLFLVGRLFNAVCDPFFGWISDHSTLKLGRRIPFMFFGAPLLGICFSCLFFPPVPDRTSSENTIYFCLVFACFNIMNSFTTSPYTAFLPELSANKKERVHLGTFSGLFALVGNLLAAMIGPFQGAFPEGLTIGGITYNSGLQVMAVVAGVLYWVGFWTPLLVLREKSRLAKKRTNLFKEMYIAFRNPAFISLIGVSCLLPMGVILVIGGLPYLCTQILETEEGEHGLVPPGQGETWVGIISGILVGGALIWFPFIGIVVAKFGKKNVMLASGVVMSLLILMVSIVKFFPDPAVPMLVGCIFLSFPAAISFILPPAIYGDVVDFDEQRTGVRREGIYAGTQAFVNKCLLALASALIVYLLSLGSSGEDSLGISLIFVVAGGVVALGTGMFWTHPLKL